eukprot:16979-Heterococcus_DN1.PRE.3
MVPDAMPQWIRAYPEVDAPRTGMQLLPLMLHTAASAASATAASTDSSKYSYCNELLLLRLHRTTAK